MTHLSHGPSWQLALGSTVLVILAVAALALIGWRGLANQKFALQEEGRRQAQNQIDTFQQALAKARESDTHQVVLYASPPSPGERSFNRQASKEALSALLLSSEHSQTGLPISVLAAVELARRSGAIEDIDRALTLAVRSFPSFITPKVLAQFPDRAREAGWTSRWEADEQARVIWQKHQPIITPTLCRDGETISYLEQQTPNQIISITGPLLEKLMPMGSPLENLSLEMDGVNEGSIKEPIIEQPFLNGILKAGAGSTKNLQQAWAEQRRRMVFFLASTLLIITTGLATILYGLHRARQIAHARSQFVASVTHELRAPVGSIQLMAQALAEKRLSGKKISDFHRLISQESSRLSVLIENVLNLARVEDGRRVLQTEQTSLPDLTEEMAQLMAPRLEEKRLTIARKGPDLTVRTDPVALRQILVNLLDNAVKFSPSQSIITIRWGLDWWMEVSDEGPGIPAGHEDKIFDRFFRAEDELRRQSQGVGIGLSLVQELVEMQSGTISVISDHGATFRIQF